MSNHDDTQPSYSIPEYSYSSGEYGAYTSSIEQPFNSIGSTVEQSSNGLSSFKSLGKDLNKSLSSYDKVLNDDENLLESLSSYNSASSKISQKGVASSYDSSIISENYTSDESNSLSSRDEILQYALGSHTSCSNESTYRDNDGDGDKEDDDEDSNGRSSVDDPSLSGDEDFSSSSSSKKEKHKGKGKKGKGKKGKGKKGKSKGKDNHETHDSGDSCDYKAKTRADNNIVSTQGIILISIFLFILLIILFIPSVDRGLARYIKDWRYRLFCKAFFFIIIFILLASLIHVKKAHH